MTTIAIPFSGALPLALFLAKATLLLVLALAATIPLRRSTAGARHLVWLAALVGVLALPLLSRIPSLHIGVLPSSLAFTPATPSSTPSSAPGSAPGSAPVIAAAPVAADPSARRSVATSAGREQEMPALQVVAIAWAAITVSLLGWLAAGALSVRRIVRESRELDTGDWTTPLCEVADRLDLDVPPRLMLSDRIEMAFACRALAPTIVLPADAESWTDDRRRAVLFHELAHVKRHDLISHALGRVACALYWFHPLVWTAARHLRAESERACDDLVLSCGARPSEYAQHLLDMVTSVRRHGAPVMALPMARKKEFEGRMLAILDPAIRRASPGRRQSALVVTVVGLTALLVAAAVPVPVSAAAAPAPVDIAPTPVAKKDAKKDAKISSAIADAEADPPAGARRSTSTTQAGDTTRAALLARVLATDADASVRRAAAWGLEQAQTGAGRAALITALHDDADASVREMAAWALAEYEAADAGAALGAALRDANARVRATSAWALGSRGDSRDAELLARGISDADAQVRQTSIWALGQLDLHSAPPPLVRALTDSSVRVRQVAAWTLGQIGDRAVVPAITSAFKAEQDAQVRLTEIWALGGMDAMPREVLDVALASSDVEVRRRAVAMMAGSNGAWPWPWPWPQPRISP